MNLQGLVQQMNTAVDNLEALDIDAMSIYEQRDYMEALTDLQQQLDDVARALTTPIVREIEPAVVDIVRGSLVRTSRLVVRPVPRPS